MWYTMHRKFDELKEPYRFLIFFVLIVIGLGVLGYLFPNSFLPYFVYLLIGLDRIIYTLRVERRDSDA